MKLKFNLLILLLFLIGKMAAQTATPPYMFITQQQFDTVQTVLEAGTPDPSGTQDIPSMLDFGEAFTVYVDVAKNAYSGKDIFLFMQDWQNGTGAVNGGAFQSTPNNVPSLIFTKIVHPTSSATLDRYQLTVPAGAYPTLMNSGSGWSSLPNGSIIRPSFYIGSRTAPSGQGTWNQFVVPAISIWGWKDFLKLTPAPVTNTVAIVEMDQYTPITRNLEQMLLSGVAQPGGGTYTLAEGTYTWYLDDQYGASPHTHTVNNPNKWFNNIYQSGLKPWINSSYVDMSNPAYTSVNSTGNSCYTLNYYVIPSSYVPSSQYVDSTTFRSRATKVIIKIRPLSVPPVISSPITIIKQDYGSAAAGTQWGPALPAGQTTYSYAGQYLPGDGDYSIGQDIKGKIYNFWGNIRPSDWYIPQGGADAPAKKYDHTSGNGTGFMYLINADANPGVFYHNTFTVCPSMNLQFSLWLMNMSDGTRLQNTSPEYRIKPNVRIQIYSGAISTPTGTALLDFYTGEIPMTGIWEQYFTPVFKVPASTSQISVFYTNVTNGGTGNDFMIDDIRIQRSNGAFEFSIDDYQPCLSSTDPYHINALWDTEAIQRIYGSPSPSSFYYQWKFYPDATDPATVSGTGIDPVVEPDSPPPSGTAAYPGTGGISIIVPGSQVGVYRLTIATTVAGLSDQCATYSYYVFSPPQTPEIIPSVPSPICPGSPVNLTVVNSNVTNQRDLLWYTEGPDGSPVPLLDSDGNQVYGSDITVTPFSTTIYIASISGCTDRLEYQVTTQPGPDIDFGVSPNRKATGYVYRTAYNSVTAIQIHANYVSGNGTISYQVYQDSVAHGILLYSGIIASGSSDIMTIDPALIKPDPDNFRSGINTVTCAVVMTDNSTSCGNVRQFQIRFIADRVVWAPGLNASTPTDNTNWNNDANWYITDELGNRYAEGGIPMESSTVIIPGDAAGYPVLRGDYTGVANMPTDDGFNSQPRCDSIIFQFGGEVAQHQYLHYTQTFVELNFGTYDESGSFTNMANLMNTDGGQNYYPYFLSRDRYYSMSAPLKDMYVGDLAFGGRPNSYIKYADPIMINNIRADANAEIINKWTISIPSYDIPLTAGFGFGYEVYSGDLSESWPYKNNQKNLNSVSGIVRWPYFTNSSYLANINPRHLFAGNSTGAGTSTFNYYVEGRPDSLASKADVVTRRSVTINSKAVPLANRFIAEDNTNAIPPNYPVVAIGNKQSDSEILVGNPFMSHLDFQQFYLKNKGAIGQYYRIWLGSAQYYSVSVDAGGNYVASTDPVLSQDIPGTDMRISPMQSFFVPVLSSPSGSSLTFDIGSMSITKPDKLTALRSSGQESRSEILKITAENSRYSAAAVIVYKKEEKILGEGVPKLFSPSGNIPEIYLMQGYKKEIIEINRNTQSIPLGLKTRVTGETLTLTFHGLERFSSDVSILDRKTGAVQVLTETDNEFKFMNMEGNQENRFYLLFAPEDARGLDQITDADIRIYAVDNHIRVHSLQADPIQSVEIYSAQGQLLSGEKNLSAVSYTSGQINEKGVYVVKVKTVHNSVTKKMIIY